jgi:hypothetical protein
VKVGPLVPPIVHETCTVPEYERGIVRVCVPTPVIAAPDVGDPMTVRASPGSTSWTVNVSVGDVPVGAAFTFTMRLISFVPNPEKIELPLAVRVALE